jgi:hypothetical protein
MKTKTQRELNLEYWGRVHDMCDAYNKQHGTNIKTQQCVKYYGNVWDLPIKHPVFDDKNYDLAVAIIEDTPVFVGDKIYTKRTGQEVTVSEGFLSAIDYTLKPPKKKRTFELNGQQLPCPGEDYDESALELLGEHFYFESLEDRNKVAKAINDLLNNARDKD